MKPNLKELNLEKLKKIAAKTPRIRVKLTRKHWIFIGCAVVVLVVLLSVSGSATITVWNRRSNALSFSKYF
jgi:hypothetical protein